MLLRWGAAMLDSLCDLLLDFAAVCLVCCGVYFVVKLACCAPALLLGI